MKPNIVTEPRVCRNPECKKEYQAEIICLMGVRLLRGEGYCSDCAKKELESQEAKELAVKQATITSQRRQWRDTCGIPRKFMLQEFKGFDTQREGCSGLTKAYEKCLNYANKFPLDQSYLGYPSLLLVSDSSWGIGKTHLACSIAHNILNRWNGEGINWEVWNGELFKSSCPVRFISEPDLFLQIQATYNYSPEEKPYRDSETDIINKLVSVRLLLIDDVGKRRVQDPRFVQRVLFSIIDGRYKAMRPMVVTANLSPEGLKLYLGGGGDEASFDRLWEMVKGKFIKIEGESYRR